MGYKLESGVTPVQRVMQMMGEMLAKGKVEKAKEEAVFEEYQAWCKEVHHEKTISIRDAGEAVEKLSAGKAKADADVTALNDAVAQLSADIAKAKADKKASAEVRETERADYEALHTDYSESISAMGDAIRTIGANPAQIANALVQLPSKMQQAINALQLDAPAGVDGAGSAFQSSSGGILDTLKSMKGQMSDERGAAETQEAKQRNAYEMLQQQLTMSVEAMSDELDAVASGLHDN